MLTARRRNNLVLVLHKVFVPNPPFNDVEAWVQFAQVWVSIDPERGREIFEEQERTAVVTHKIRGDYQELRDLDETMMVVHHPSMSYPFEGSPPVWGIAADARVFNIMAVMPDFETRGDVVLAVTEDGRRWGTMFS